MQYWLRSTRLFIASLNNIALIFHENLTKPNSNEHNVIVKKKPRRRFTIWDSEARTHSSNIPRFRFMVLTAAGLLRTSWMKQVRIKYN